MSDPWTVLGLERGADRVEIRRAYARRLKQTNPEDDPQGFMKLRQAYEWLLDHVDYQADELEEIRLDHPEAEFGHKQPPVEAPALAASPWAAADQTDPDELRIDRLLDELNTHLAGAGNEGRPRSRELIAEILSQPALGGLSVAARVEHRLAHIILEHLPYSDAILLQSVEAFDWADQRRAHEYPFSGVIARLDEWRLIHSLERSDDELHKAWLLLTRPTGSATRWWHARTARREQVAELLDYAEYSAPGLVHSIDPEAAAWWQEELRHDRLAVDSLLWRLVAGLALGLALPSFGLTAWQSGLAGGGVVLASMADLLLARRLLAARAWKHRPDWQFAAPLLAMLAVPPVLMLVPLSPATAVLTVIAAVGLVWAARLILADPTGVPRDRRWATALGLSAMIYLASTTDEPIPLAQFVVLAAVAWLLQLNLPMLRPAAAAVVDRLTKDWAWPVLAAYGLGLLAIAWVADGPGHTPLVRVGIAAFAVFAGGGIAVFATRPIPPIILAAMLVAANLSVVTAQGYMINDQLSNSATPGEALVSVHGLAEGVELTKPQQQARAALEEMERRNPQFYTRITPMLDGSTGKAKAQAARQIDSAIDAELVRLLPLSSNKLIGQHERLKADIAADWRGRDQKRCVLEAFVIDGGTAPELRSRHRENVLAIVAHGPADPAEAREAAFPAKEFAASRAQITKVIENSYAPPTSDEQARRLCTERVATAQALALLSDDQLGTLRRQSIRQKPAGN